MSPFHPRGDTVAVEDDPLAEAMRFLLHGEDERTTLALDGVHSGDPIEVGPGYWEAKHQRLDERVR